jgi:hypothetical protein
MAMTACSDYAQGVDDLGEAVDDTARAGTKGVVAATLATRFPEVPKELITPFTDCVIDNATASELRHYAGAAIVGASDTTVDTIKGALTRPETVQCLGKATA